MGGVLITGATSGIGRQLALDYAQSGQRVIACGRSQSALQSLCDASPLITALQFDVTDYGEVQRCLSHLPFIPNLWIFNAGCCEYIENGQVDAQLIASVFAVNFQGVVNCIAASQAHYCSGHKVVVVSSIAGELALPRAQAYGASKAALSYFCRSLAIDLAPQNIAVVTVCPGFVQTPMTDKNTFAMPMLISVTNASQSIRRQIARGKSTLYFPWLFTGMVRVIAALPYSWQRWLMGRWVRPAGGGQ